MVRALRNTTPIAEAMKGCGLDAQPCLASLQPSLKVSRQERATENIRIVENRKRLIKKQLRPSPSVTLLRRGALHRNI